MTEQGAENVVLWFNDLEIRLSEFLSKIPYSESNGDTQLPLLSPIIAEAGSLIDTVFRELYDNPPEDRRRLKIQDFASHYEAKLKLSNLRTLLYQFPPILLNPFRSWTSERTGGFTSLTWWAHYNRIKHNRIEEYELATLSTAVNILCALQQIIAKTSVFTGALWRHHMLFSTSYSPTPYIGQRIEESPLIQDALVETRLFASAVGYKQFGTEISGIRPSDFTSEKLVKFLGKW